MNGHTVQQLVYQHKIVLHSLLIELAKVAPSQRDQLVQELKHQRRIRVTLRDSHQIDILMLHMAEGRATQREYWRPDLRIRNDLNAKDVPVMAAVSMLHREGGAGSSREAWTRIGAEGTEDQVLAFLIEDQYSRNHDCDAVSWRGASDGAFHMLAVELLDVVSELAVFMALADP